MEEHERPAQASPMSQDAYSTLREKLQATKKSVADLEQALDAIAPQATPDSHKE